ncbi:MAG: hypothetical protein HQ513_14790 [Rhodospirillales bacterium]|nr:hypothetical protein [Rhodospirillales bacterium]
MKDNLLSTSQWAWEFLRRNPKYRSDWSQFHKGKRLALDQSFPLLRQKALDQEAAKWGLLAFEDPDTPSLRALPFWAIGPILEAEIIQHGDEALLPLLRKTGTRVSGLQLLGGALILTLEKNNQFLQLWLRDGRSFDETSNVVLRLPVNVAFPIQIARCLNFWNLITSKQAKKITALWERVTQSNSWPLTA